MSAYLIGQYVGIAFVAIFIAWLLLKLFYPRHASNEGKRSLVLVALAGLIAASIIVLRVQQNDPKAEADRALSQIEIFQLIKEEEPQTYERLLNTLSSIDIRNESERQTAISQAQIELIPILVKRLPKTSSEALWGFVGNMYDLIGDLERTNGVLCYQYLFPSPNNMPNTGELQAVLRNKNQQILDSLSQVYRDYDENHVVPSDTDVEYTLIFVFNELKKKHGDDVNMLATMNAPTDADKAQVCTITKELYGLLLQRHDQAAEDALRVMFYGVAL